MRIALAICHPPPPATHSPLCEVYKVKARDKGYGMEGEKGEAEAKVFHGIPRAWSAA